MYLERPRAIMIAIKKLGVSVVGTNNARVHDRDGSVQPWPFAGLGGRRQMSLEACRPRASPARQMGANNARVH